MGTEVSHYSPSAKWSIRLSFLVGLYVIGAFTLSPHAFLILGRLYAEKFVIGIPILLVGGVCVAALIFGREAPTRYAVDIIRTRMRNSMPVLLFFLAGLTAFSTYKSIIPSIVPFYADIGLADLDEWLHGTAPWELAHHLNSDLWALFIVQNYEVVWFAQWFGIVLFAAMWSDGVARIRYLWAIASTISIVGTLLALLLSSVGPIFYDHFIDGGRFAGLISTLHSLEPTILVREYADYLLMLHTSGDAGMGSGISAMPSMHVALAALNAYFLSSLNRWLGTIGWAFTMLTLFGPVCTGWHYAVDGYIANIVVSAIWWATGRFVRE